ncbi:hypothetical protein J6590_016806 [Homalodisca vitripennis]|nr:hypothetical protein J6590_016806 [Homalodisca vitripennis]
MPRCAVPKAEANCNVYLHNIPNGGDYISNLPPNVGWMSARFSPGAELPLLLSGCSAIIVNINWQINTVQWDATCTDPEFSLQEMLQSFSGQCLFYVANEGIKREVGSKGLAAAQLGEKLAVEAGAGPCNAGTHQTGPSYIPGLHLVYLIVTKAVHTPCSNEGIKREVGSKGLAAAQLGEKLAVEAGAGPCNAGTHQTGPSYIPGLHLVYLIVTKAVHTPCSNEGIKREVGSKGLAAAQLGEKLAVEAGAGPCNAGTHQTGPSYIPGLHLVYLIVTKAVHTPCSTRGVGTCFDFPAKTRERNTERERWCHKGFFHKEWQHDENVKNAGGSVPPQSPDVCHSFHVSKGRRVSICNGLPSCVHACVRVSSTSLNKQTNFVDISFYIGAEREGAGLVSVYNGLPEYVDKAYKPAL